MSRGLRFLDRRFRPVAKTLLENCETRSVVLRPFCTERDPSEQARLWRQSRTSCTVNEGIEFMKKKDAPWLAQVINEVGPQCGSWATSFKPGESWHQWGLAMDCYVLENDEAQWDPTHPGYQTYHEEADKLDLISSLNWEHVDATHVHFPSDRSPLVRYPWSEISKKMEHKYN